VNMDEGEFLHQQTVNTTPNVQDGLQGGVARHASVEQPEQLDQARISASTPFQEPVDGTGGGAHEVVAEKSYNFRNMLGSGPYLDATDDLTSFVDLNVEQSADQAITKVLYRLYWDVDVVEGVRGKFASPY